MSTVTYENAPATVVTATPVAAQGKGIFRRLLDALIEARMRRARDEIARHAHLLPREFDLATFGMNANADRKS
jgi:hypothetical protein